MRGSNGENACKRLEPLWAEESQASSFPCHFTGCHRPLSRVPWGSQRWLDRSFGNCTAVSIPRDTNLLGFMGELEAMYFETFLQWSASCWSHCLYLLLSDMSLERRLENFLMISGPWSVVAPGLCPSLWLQRSRLASALMFPFIPKMNFFFCPSFGEIMYHLW